MSLNSQVSAERLHIGFFGCRNAGKSSVVNAVTGQELAVVSDVKGTTTDPVTKAMEILPLGPVVIIDTPGFDDEGGLGEKRVLRTKQILNRTDVAVLIVDASEGLNETDKELINIFEEKLIPWVLAFNKSDLVDEKKREELLNNARQLLNWDDNEITEDSKPYFNKDNIIFVSALKNDNIHELKEMLAGLQPEEDPEHRLLRGVANAKDVVVLVCPIDESAPKGRIILPQQQAIRDCLDIGAQAVVCTEFTLKDTLESLAVKPRIVITDSQAFKIVSEITPEDIPLTSFSILLARYKGFLETAVRGVKAIDDLKDGDVILMAEGCTHHRQCNDIGTVKIPNMLKKLTGKELVIKTCSGREFPEDLSEYALIIHCGGCMITEREVMYRMKCANDQRVPFANYGLVLAKLTGTLDRSILPLVGEH